MLAQLAHQPPARFVLGDAEHGQEGPAGGDHGHVAFQHHHGVAHGVDNALGQLPVQLAFRPRGAFLADILDRQQDRALVQTGLGDLAGIDQHGAPADGGEVVIHLEPLDRFQVGQQAFQQDVHGGNVPLAIAQPEDMAALGFRLAGAEHLIKGAVGRGYDQVAVKDQQGAGDGLDDVARRDAANDLVRHGSRFLEIDQAGQSGREHLIDRMMQLLGRVGLAQEMLAVDEQGFHGVGDKITRRV